MLSCKRSRQYEGRRKRKRNTKTSYLGQAIINPGLVLHTSTTLAHRAFQMIHSGFWPSLYLLIFVYSKNTGLAHCSPLQFTSISTLYPRRIFYTQSLNTLKSIEGIKLKFDKSIETFLSSLSGRPLYRFQITPIQITPR